MRALLRTAALTAAALPLLAGAASAAPLQASWHATSWSAVTLLNGKAEKNAKVTASAPCAIGTCTAQTTANSRGAWKVRFDAIVPAGTTSIAVSLRSGSVSKVKTLALKAPTTSKPGSGTVMVIGDSLAVGTALALQSALPTRRVTTQAAVGRPLLTGMSILARTPLDSRIKVGVFSLFTNDDPANIAGLRAQVQASLKRLGSQRCAVWYTIRRPKLNGVSYQAANKALYALAANPAYGGRLLIVPWYEAVADNHDLVTADRVHGTTAGNKVRAKLTADAVKRCPVL